MTAVTRTRPRPVTSTAPAGGRATPRISDRELRGLVGGILNRHPAVGLAVGVVRDGRLDIFHGHGFADLESRAPVSRDTVFRTASVTKLVTAVAVMQLVENGLLDLDAPANDYLRTFQLLPAEPGFRPATLRHLLTHTAGVPDVVHVSDLLHPSWGSFESRPAALSVRLDESIPPLAAVYGRGLPVVIQPGTAFAYSNHGFAMLGQIVEDVSGQPLDRYLRERVFEPLGMADTDIARSGRLQQRLATGYELGSGRPRAVTDREWVTRGASAIYSTTRDMARFAEALLGRGANDEGRILEPQTLAAMFEPSFQADPRLPGIGLAFFRFDAGGHLVVGHDGRMPGFNAQLLIAPDDGVGIIGFTNGSRGALSWMPIELEALLRRLVGAADDVIRTDVPHHPEIWSELCGTYRLPPRVSDLRGRLAMGGGVEVFVRGGRLMARLRLPVPALYRGLPLHPDDEADPTAFRLDLRPFDMPVVRVLFRLPSAPGPRALHTDLACLSLYGRPAVRGARRWIRAAAAGALAAATLAAVRRRRRP